MVVLLGAALPRVQIALPVSIAVAALLAIVIALVPADGPRVRARGGAYIVARENLGTLPSLIAAAALLVDYVLTVAVSVAAGVLAITSAVALAHYLTRRALARGASVLIALVNLRGVRESGFAFALPTYSFIVAMLVAVGVGVAKCATRAAPPVHPPSPPAPARSASSCCCGRSRRAQRPDRRGGDRQRRQGVRAPAVEERGPDTRVLGIIAFTVPRRHVPRRRARSPPEPTDSVVSQVARRSSRPAAPAPATGWSRSSRSRC